MLFVYNISLIFVLYKKKKCSVSCGSGLQQRKVECTNSNGDISTTCDQKIKPVATQECSTGMSCADDPPIGVI